MKFTCLKCNATKEQKRYALGTVQLECGHVFFLSDLQEVTDEPILEQGLTIVQEEPVQTEALTVVEETITEMVPFIPVENQEPQVTEENFENFKLPRPELYQFQNDGIDFALKAMNPDNLIRVLIADEMGLGKTAQSIVAVVRAIAAGKVAGPILALVTASTKLNWFKEWLRWAGITFTPQVIEKSTDILIPGFQVYIATYDILRRFTKKNKKTVNGIYSNFTVVEKENPFYTFPFKTIILDEAHKIKNSDSQRSAEVEKICQGDKNIIALSGTPIVNNAAEYAQLMTILRPDIFPSVDSFISRHVQTWDTYGGHTKKGGLSNPTRFRELTKDFIIRRERADVMSQLPKVRRTFYNVDFDDAKTRAAYEAEENELVRQIEKDYKDKAMPANILGIIARMRHIVGVTKISAIAELVQEFLLENNRPLVVFCHHDDVLQSLTMLAKVWSYKAEVIESQEQEPRLFHAGLNAQQREEMIDDFRAGKFRVMIASTKAGGEGINLQFCADCIIAERQWNPATEEQAEGRFVRIGSDSTMEKFGMTHVNAIYPTVINTIDEYFCELVEKKRAIFSAAVNNRELTWEEQTLMRELLNVVAQKNRKKAYKGF